MFHPRNGFTQWKRQQQKQNKKNKEKSYRCHLRLRFIPCFQQTCPNIDSGYSMEYCIIHQLSWLSHIISVNYGYVLHLHCLSLSLVYPFSRCLSLFHVFFFYGFSSFFLLIVNKCICIKIWCKIFILWSIDGNEKRQ